MLNRFQKRSLLIPLLILFLNISICFSQEEELKLAKEGDGIQVFKQKKALNKLDRVVAYATINANYMDIVCLMKDFENQHNWVYANHEAMMLDSIDAEHWIYYGVAETPWPLQDRDVVTTVELIVNQEKHSVLIHSFATPDIIDLTEDKIRIQTLDTKWKITKISQDSSFVELDMFMDVGGGVPKWLVRLFSANGPFNTLKNMKEELLKPENINCDCGYKELLD